MPFIRKNRLLFKIASTILVCLWVFNNTLVLADDSSLEQAHISAPVYYSAEKDGALEFLSLNLCTFIERSLKNKEATSVKTILSLKWLQDWIEDNGWELEELEHEVRIYLPGESVCIRYYDYDPRRKQSLASEDVPSRFIGWIKGKITEVTPHIRREAFRRTLALPAPAVESNSSQPDPAEIDSIVERIMRPVSVALFRDEALFVTGIPPRCQRAALERLIPSSDEVVFIDLGQWIEEWGALDKRGQYDRLNQIEQLLLRDEKTLAIYGYEDNSNILDFVWNLRGSYNTGAGSKRHRVIILGEDPVISTPCGGGGFHANSPFYNYPQYVHLTKEGAAEYRPGEIAEQDNETKEPPDTDSTNVPPGTPATLDVPSEEPTQAQASNPAEEIILNSKGETFDEVWARRKEKELKHSPDMVDPRTWPVESEGEQRLASEYAELSLDELEEKHKKLYERGDAAPSEPFIDNKNQHYLLLAFIDELSKTEGAMAHYFVQPLHRISLHSSTLHNLRKRGRLSPERESSINEQLLQAIEFKVFMRELMKRWRRSDDDGSGVATGSPSSEQAEKLAGGKFESRGTVGAAKVADSKRNDNSDDPESYLLDPQANWATAFRDNSKPLKVEVGFGQGTHLVERAKHETESNYIGIESERTFCTIWERRLQREGPSLDNLKFINTADWNTVVLQPNNCVSELMYLSVRTRYKETMLRRQQLFKDIARIIEPGGLIFISADSNLPELAEYLLSHGFDNVTQNVRFPYKSEYFPEQEVVRYVFRKHIVRTEAGIANDSESRPQTGRTPRRGPIGSGGGYVNKLITQAERTLRKGEFEAARELAEDALGWFGRHDEGSDGFFDELDAVEPDPATVSEFTLAERKRAERVTYAAQLLAWEEADRLGKEYSGRIPVWGSNDAMLGRDNASGECVTLTPGILQKIHQIPGLPSGLLHRIGSEAVRREASIEPSDSAWVFVQSAMVADRDPGEDPYRKEVEDRLSDIYNALIQQFGTATIAERRNILDILERYHNTAIRIVYSVMCVEGPQSNVHYALQPYGWEGLYQQAAKLCGDMQEEVKSRITEISGRAFANTRVAAGMHHMRKSNVDTAKKLFERALEVAPDLSGFIEQELRSLNADDRTPPPIASIDTADKIENTHKNEEKSQKSL